ncbi:glycolate oxidase subunit GlcF [Granulibacter bethesdensis]|uniref:Glycolate oxidase iron-sulfur subunit n=1 Tax=Granulibacter bethesdensis (strain ATCC BAA-1260 / CGDNIH1) TaxID=391165 RepID=Q0BTR8_GRABC|nr:glycolate oxidase subunit GlcF [Granulibacter bethesdensis]ABI61784.1 (S)-2-hydroxy-acid oxidase subunit GlcF [Granulibacter bethesdensis CGDNIH1]AHJ69391.1 (S)-2-hydroxy-acid oxidase subunit GlcF [Granulibacter bethesdensis]APH51594.1 (S)-2-hydroxy-acid oxidase subunit GlcF [Granulibacter bethesdensis]APH64287.1 (S)-2-hydroxy-acid oxidase subunit GlcF [Granulibacter bethesdensis]
MQTSFTPEQLRDPDIAASNQVLRTCVHCGFCTATCPTFVLLGDELDSPRGRIYLIKDMLENGRAATQEVVKHLDRCLSCLSCMSTCPSGVNYMHLIDHARSHVEKTYHRPWHDRLLRAVLARVLPSVSLLRGALVMARITRPLAGVIPALLPKGHLLGQRLRALLDLAPKAPSSGHAVKPGLYRGQAGMQTVKRRVGLLTGCAQQVLSPSINEATIRLLNRLGVEVVVTAEQGCCGALTQHMGQHDRAMAAARANILAWSREIEGEGLDAVIVNTSGCGTTVKDYGFMFRNEAEAAQAEKVASLALDISEYLCRIGYTPTPLPEDEAPLTVAYHAACSLQHGQQIRAEPKNLLVQAGFQVVEPVEPHLCCGSAGTYNIMQPDIATRLRDRKRGNLRALQPDLVAAGNIGCIKQLGCDSLPALHMVELLDWRAGGPEPEVVRIVQARRAASAMAS